ERQGFGPGVIDGKMGLSTKNALAGFQEANGLKETGEIDQPTQAALRRWANIPATRVVTIPDAWGKIPFQPTPKEPADQAKLPQLGYQSMDEKLAERFHTTVGVLAQLNPGGQPARAGQTSVPSPSASPNAPAIPQPSMFRAGQQVRVPNIGADRIDASTIDDKNWLATLVSLGVGSNQAKVTRIVVSKSTGTLKAFDAQDKLVALFTVTSGSSHDPLPLGNWGINGVSKNPPFAYDPDLFWDVPDSVEKQQLPPGPNGPVGVVWIDLTKEHYGIHGTPEPQTIGRAESHGCVRLTNWDAARLAQMVSGSTKVLFEA
ncbi:MAG TPA: L,D-transpeptidase family protein, partial [Croceibacterium sp.]|nr:L,D-transpeptidase family protein [Croceibacterium sp.]